MAASDPSPSAALQISGLCRSLGAFVALRDVSLSVAEGEHVALVGPSGSGKGMLLRCLRDLDTCQRGRIEVGGGVIAAPAAPPPRLLAQMRQCLPFVAAEALLPAGRSVMGCCASVAQRAGLPPAFAEDDAAAMLSRLGLMSLAARRTDSLTPGERQAVAIARAVTTRGAVMLLDDPAAMLTGAEADVVSGLIAQLAAEGVTMLSASDDLAMVRRTAARVVFMDGGQIVEIADTERFFTAPGSARAAQFLASRSNRA